eukprot:TRINITY_DN735_c0_g3_i1.p1 TRINITY_DN735_c0_g3~~TRINITY_DN735_c0_g3_i1.p1  ORF type:complete len:1299 (+),score=445.56 TRINITY_DN735_c0_g3_i1:87-3983(+)
MRRVRLPVKALLLGTTFVSTGVSVLAGWLLYEQGIDALEDTVAETSDVQLASLNDRLRETWKHLDMAVANTEVLLRQRREFGWSPGPSELAGFFHWLSWTVLKQSGLLYTFGAYTISTPDRSMPDTFYQEVWYDVLADGSQEWVSGTYLPSQYNSSLCPNRFHCVYTLKVDEETGRRGEMVYTYTQKTDDEFVPGRQWRTPANWKSSDGTTYVWFGVNHVVDQLELLPNTFTVIVAYITFTPWQKVLMEEEKGRGSQTVLAITQLFEGRQSRVFGHNLPSYPQQPQSCGDDIPAGDFDLYDGRCHLVLADLPAAVQDGAVHLNRTRPGVFIIDRAGGEDYFMRMSLFFNFTTDMEPLYLLWMRPVASVQHKVLAALIQLLVLCGVILIFDIVVAVLEVVLLARPLEVLQGATVWVELMDLDAADRKLDKVLTAINEVARLVRSVRNMVNSLRDFRAYIPQAVFNEIDEGVLVDATSSFNESVLVQVDLSNPVERPSVRRSASDVQRHQSHAEAVAGVTERDAKGLAGRLERRKLLKDAGPLRPRRSSMLIVSAEIAGAPTRSWANPGVAGRQRASQHATVTALVNAFVRPSLTACRRHSGVVLLIGPEAICMSWNTHSSRPDHMLCAARCASTLAKCLADEEDDTSASTMSVASGATGSESGARSLPFVSVLDHCGVGVASGLMHVGHVGTSEQRAPVAVGEAVVLASALSQLARRISAVVLIAETVNDAVANSIQTRVVDAVPPCPREGAAHGGAPCLVYEVMALDEDTAQHTAAYARGFGALRALRLSEAISAFCTHLAQCPLDYQAVRLLKVCMSLEARRGRGKSLEAEYHRGWLGWEPVEDQSLECPGVLANTPTQELWCAEHSLRSSGQLVAVSLCKSRSTLTHSPKPTEFGKDLFKRMEAEGKISAVSTSLDLPPHDPLATSSPPTRLSTGKLAVAGSSVETTRSAASFGGAPVQTVLPRMWPTGDHSAGQRTWKRSDRKLGSGTFGEVWLAMGEGGDLAAMKILSLPSDGTWTAERAREAVAEIDLLDRLRNDNVVSHLGSGLVGDHLVIVMEFLAGGSLEGLLQQFGGQLRVSAVQRYMKDILRGLKFLHTQQPPVVHRDLKPGNVLLTIDGICKLADFGSAGEIAREVKGHGAMGTAIYMAPEQAKGCAGPPSDIWSAGVLLLQLISGELPYDLTGFNQFRFMIRLSTLAGQDSDPEGVGPQIARDRVQPDAADFAERCFNLHPDRRPTAMALLTTAFLLNPQAEARAASPNASGDSSAGQMGCAVESVLDEVVVPSAVMETVDSEEDD